MPEIQAVVDDTLNELTSEHLLLKEVVDQFQQKCLMSFPRIEVVCHSSGQIC
jgi:hypothetical protein